jgi:dipeptidyl aminopeptidase/acylaminoacyl peptidase
MPETNSPSDNTTEKQTESAPTAWTPELMMQVKGVGSVRVSPDGRRVAFTVSEPVMTDEKSERRTQIWLANADGSEAFQATHAEKSSQNPNWSPDGRYLAFTSDRQEKKNLYLLRADGGEAEPLAEAKADIGAFDWSPDGRSIAFVMPDPKTEEEEKREKAKDDWRWVEEEIKVNRLYVLSLEKDAEGKRAPRRLTTGDVNVGGGFGGSPFDWSPDGKSITFTHTKTPGADDWVTSDISVVNVESGETRPLAATGAAEMQPLYSPDGRWIAYRASDDPPRWAFSGVLHVIPAEGGAPRALPATHDSQPSLIGWSADGRHLFFSEAHGTTTRLCAMEVEDGAITELNEGGGLSWEFHLNRSRTVFGFTWQTSDRPIEAHVARVEAFTPVPVSRVNAGLPDLPLGRTEVIRWKSADGLEIEGLLTYPVGYEAGRRVPLLLDIHGGPAGVYGESFIAGSHLYPVAAFAARGYAVLRANPRGSGGYGKAFRYANEKDWGGGDYRDLMAGVDHVIAMGVADPDRMGVMGWSYGGFMTSWVITQTNRFKAASTGAAVTNLMSFNGTSDIPGFVPDYFGAQSWEDLEIYRAHSAMFQVQGVTTPTLIQHPEADVRVPISQGYELYNALKQQGVPVRMLVLPRQPHGPEEPKMTLKVMQTNIEWFDQYVGGTK